MRLFKSLKSQEMIVNIWEWVLSYFASGSVHWSLLGKWFSVIWWSWASLFPPILYLGIFPREFLALACPEICALFGILKRTWTRARTSFYPCIKAGMHPMVRSPILISWSISILIALFPDLRVLALMIGFSGAEIL